MLLMGISTSAKVSVVDQACEFQITYAEILYGPETIPEV